jgi:sugar lactone lactonase YvrE
MRQPDQIIPCGAVLGEGPVWDAERQRLLWTDIQSRRLYELKDGAVRHWDTPERLCCLALVEDEPDRLLAAFETGLAGFDPDTGKLDWLQRPELGHTGRRFNDGRVDRQGRLWTGTMVEAAEIAGADTASLWRVDHDGALSRHREGIHISNGACFSPDGATLYFADSPKQTIWALELDPQTGDIRSERLFAKVTEGYPDGSTIDAEGCVWNARWGAGIVVRHAPDGREIERLSVPVSQPTSAAFGGADLKTLYVTSARDELSEQTLAAEPHAGDVFAFHLEVAGLPEPRWRGRLPG